MSNVNQLPYKDRCHSNYKDRLKHLNNEFDKVVYADFGGKNKDAKLRLRHGEFRVSLRHSAQKLVQKKVEDHCNKRT